MNDTILNKKVSIERCIRQIERYYRNDTGLAFEQDYLKQDAIAMNLQRAAELTIDIANHLIKTRKLGLPQDSRDCFLLLQRAGLIDADRLKRLQGMVGFRNILVHAYTKLDMAILIDVIEHRTTDLLEFADLAVEAAG